MKLCPQRWYFISFFFNMRTVCFLLNVIAFRSGAESFPYSDACRPNCDCNKHIYKSSLHIKHYHLFLWRLQYIRLISWLIKQICLGGNEVSNQIYCMASLNVKVHNEPIFLKQWRWWHVQMPCTPYNDAIFHFSNSGSCCHSSIYT